MLWSVSMHGIHYSHEAMGLGKLTTRARVDHTWSQRVTEDPSEIATVVLVKKIALDLRRARPLKKKTISRDGVNILHESSNDNRLVSQSSRRSFGNNGITNRPYFGFQCVNLANDGE